MWCPLHPLLHLCAHGVTLFQPLSPQNLWTFLASLPPGGGRKDGQEGWRSFKSLSPLEVELKSHTPHWRGNPGKPHTFWGELNCFPNPFLGSGEMHTWLKRSSGKATPGEGNS